MKLLFCPFCQDVKKLQSKRTTCECGLVAGKYVDNRNAEVTNNAILIGLGNTLLGVVLAHPRLHRSNTPLTAFVIPNCASVKRVEVVE